MANFRRSQRHRFQLDVLFRGGSRTLPALTEDLSFHGLFIRTDVPRTPNQLLRFTVLDPSSGEPLDLMGIVARCVSPAEATAERPPGVGVSLFGNSRAQDARWVDIVRRVQQWAAVGIHAPPGRDEPAQPVVGPSSGSNAPTPAGPGDSHGGFSRRPTGTAHTVLAPPPPPVAPPPRTAPVEASHPSAASLPSVAPDAAPEAEADTTLALPRVDTVRRAHPRRSMRLKVTVRPTGMAELEQFVSRDVSEGGTFVLTPELVPIGTAVSLRLVHPESGETFAMPGMVVRSVDSIEAREKGIGIRFDSASMDVRAWDDFVARQSPAEQDGPDLLPGFSAVRVLRTPPPRAPDPPVVMGPSERLPSNAGDPGGPPAVLSESERAVPLLLAGGLAPPPPPASSMPPLPPLAMPPRPQSLGPAAGPPPFRGAETPPPLDAGAPSAAAPSPRAFPPPTRSATIPPPMHPPAPSDGGPPIPPPPPPKERR